MEQEADRSLVGQTLDGRYQILGSIGEGSPAGVYRARHLNVDRDVAIKVLDPRGQSAEAPPVPVTQDLALDSDPVWAPDGKLLYFLSNRSGAVNLWRVPINEESGDLRGPAQTVTSGTASMEELAISRCGLAVSALNSQVSSLMKQSFDPATESLIGIPKEICTTSRGFGQIDVSPDNRLLAFVSDYGTSTEDLVLISADGTGRRLLTNDEFRDRRPTFSPDGGQIAFYSNRSGRYQIWTIKPDGTGLRQLTNTDHDLLAPAWTHDGRAIWAVSQEEKAVMSFDLSGELPVREGRRFSVSNDSEVTIQPAEESPDACSTP